jgi:2-oxoglutarate dehydrogenase E2 component (dihydrolipoamide succinyltransferase)
MSNIVVPELGESVVEARVARWLKKAGDRVEVGEPVVELETEKIDLEVSAEKGGVLASIARQEGEDVTIGEIQAVVDERGTAPVSEPAPTSNPIAPADSAIAPTAKPPIAPASGAIAPTAKPPIASTGSATTPGQRHEDRVRMTKRRQTIARRLVEAQRTAAMLTTFNEVDMTAVMALRERRKEAFKKEFGVGLGIASFFVKSSINALRAFPALNAEIQGEEIVYKRYYDIGVAVGAEGGLVVPVIRDADTRTFAQIETAIRDFAARAADSTLTLEDLRGGTFTITNGGVFGSLMSTPILNPPQVGILGLHKIQDRAVAVDGQVVVRPMMYVALSYDHRIVDGREAVQFLVKIKDYVEDPARLLLES